jgi:ABC-type nitrate/sulfonate/bicarbonate transport system substrate-binding protein
MSLSRRTCLALGSAMPALCVGAARAATQTVRISNTTTGNAGAVWQPLAERLGGDLLQGLELQWVGANPGQMQAQMVSGALDVSFSGAIGTVELNAKGADLVLFGPGSNLHTRWVVRGDSPYRRPQDLLGKRIATQAETSEQYKLARIAAALHGIELKRDIAVAFGPATANLALFERGDVEGVIVPEPTATRLVAAGARQIAHTGELWREANGVDAPTFLVGLAARRPWLEQNPEAASRIARLFARVNRAIQARPALLVEQHTALGVPKRERRALELLPERLAPAFSTGWDATTFALIGRQIVVAVSSGLLAAPPAAPFWRATPLEGA